MRRRVNAIEKEQKLGRMLQNKRNKNRGGGVKKGLFKITTTRFATACDLDL